MSDNVQVVTKPSLSSEELDAIGAAEQTPGAICNSVRPGTLGYQRCWRLEGHSGPHLSQDSTAWVTS